jgi:hypothetical protein
VKELRRDTVPFEELCGIAMSHIAILILVGFIDDCVEHFGQSISLRRRLGVDISEVTGYSINLTIRCNLI